VVKRILTKGRFAILSPQRQRMHSSDLDPQLIGGLHASLGPRESAP